MTKLKQTHKIGRYNNRDKHCQYIERMYQVPILRWVSYVHVYEYTYITRLVHWK